MSTKVKSILYFIVALLSNAAIIAVVPDSYKIYVGAVAAAISAFLGFMNPSAGIDKAEENMKAFGSVRSK